MHSLGLWVLQVDCTVITSLEDPGEESFQKGGGVGRNWQGRRTSCSAGVAMLSSLLKQNMNPNISSANRQRALETHYTGSFIFTSLC